jgi:hypothetical protein
MGQLCPKSADGLSSAVNAPGLIIVAGAGDSKAGNVIKLIPVGLPACAYLIRGQFGAQGHVGYAAVSSAAV